MVHKVLICCGSRPEFIKISPIYHKLKKTPEIIPILCNTGQHRELLAPHLSSLNMRPDVQLDVMQPRQSLDQLMAQLFAQLPQVFDQHRPDMLIIQGDTASALAAAMIAQKRPCPVAHIEAGLRTYDRASPFPEEIYRQNISRLAKWHFCPTQTARENLLKEKIPAETIFVTGNTSVDMVMHMHHKTHGPSPWQKERKPFFLITLHRRESQGSPLIRIISTLLDFAKSQPEFNFIIPLHPNPATSDMIRSLIKSQKNIRLIAPLPYDQFIQLMTDAFAIITDSGGIQEEAPSLNTPVIVVRDKTERAEGIISGCLRLAGTHKKGILYELNLLIHDRLHYKRMQQAPNPFGDGHAAGRITGHLTQIIERQFKSCLC